MTWEKKKVLVTVKAYPEIGKTHGTMVCTAGLTEEGEWIRLYPVPMDVFSGPNKVSKYDWIEVECQKASEKLGRKESYKIREGTLRIVDRTLSKKKVKGKVDWESRNKLILPHLDGSIESLREKYIEDKTSLGLVKPSTVLEFYKKGELQIFKDSAEFQATLFGTATPIVQEIPHIFGYNFRCEGCGDEKGHNIQCEDWELLESYRSWGQRYGDTAVLWEKLQQRYFEEMVKKDLYFYMGMYSLQPSWLIIGIYYPPKPETRSQMTLNIQEPIR